VASVDDAPTVTVPGAQDPVSAHTDTAIAGISTNDVDAGALAVKVSLGTSHGNITLDLSGGATLADATSNGSHSVHITGTLTQVNAALTSLVYHGDAAFTGADALTVQTNDLGHTGTGGPLSSSVGTVNIGVIPKVWFIDNSATGAQDGSQAHPFQSIAAFNAINDGGATHAQTGDYIYLKTGSGVYSEADGIHLLNGQQLIGGGDGLSFTDPLNNANTITVETAGTRPVIDVTGGAGNDAIHLAQDNTIHGFNVATDNAAAMGIVDNGGTVGTLNISNMNVGVDPDGAGALFGNLGQAISITHGGTAGSMAFGTVSSGGGTNGIALGGTLATNFSATGGTLSGHSVSEFSSNGGSGTVSYGGTIGDGTGLSASITGRSAGAVTLSGNINDGVDVGGGITVSGNTGGTIDFTGATKTLNTDTANAVSMTNNTSTTVNFTGGGLNIDTTSGIGFSDSVAGTVSVTGTGNTINTTSGTALNLAFVTVGAGGITFDSASTTSAATGISINTVSGGAINVNGGSIAGATANGVTIAAASDNISIASSIASTATGHSVQVTNSGVAGGNTISFSGGITDPGLGINLDNNDQGGVATVNFTGGLNIDSTTHTGFNATNGGTVNVTGTNTVDTTSGTDVNIANTTIGGSGVTFQSVNHNGNNSGIILNNTGAGTFTVTGTGTTAGSGGTIQNVVGSDGVSLNTTGGLITLKNMIIQNISASSDATDAINTRSGIDGIQGQAVNAGLTVDRTTFQNISDSGINGSVGGAGVPSATSWNGLTVTNSTFTDMGRFNVAGKGDATNEAGIYMLGIKGNVVISGNSFSNDPSGLMFTTDTSGTLDMTATSNTFTNMYKDIGTQEEGLVGISVRQAGSLSSVVRIGDKNDADPTLGNTFTNGGGVAAIVVDTTSTATGAMKVEINRNTTTVTDHTSAGTAGGSTNYNFPQGGFSLSPETTGGFEAIVGHNTFDQAMHANGGLGQLSITNHHGTAEFIVQNNTFNKPWDAPVFIRSSGDDGAPIANTQVLLQDNTYITGTVGNAGTDVGGPTPFDPAYFQALNGGRLDLTIKNDQFPADDPSSGFSHGFYAQTTSPGDILNLFLQNTSSASGYELKASAGTTFNLFRNGSASGTVQGVLTDNGNTGTAFLTGAGTVNLTNTAPIVPSISIALIAAAGGIDGSSPGETHLTQAELNAAVQSGLEHWVAAGISADQLNLLEHVTYEVGAVPTGWLGASTPGHVSISADAAGYGWFIDPTPNDNSEFSNVVSARQAFTDPDQAPAGHMDLLTTVMHEMGVQLGLSDAYDPAASSDLMFVELTAGERRLPDATDVAAADALDNAQIREGAVPLAAQAATGTPIIAGTAGNDTINAGSGGNILFGGAGADNFVFGPSTPLNAPTPAQVTHVADYHAAEGDTFDFSAITSQFHNSGVNDALVVRAVEDSSGKFATLQVDHIDPMGLPSAPNWVNVAQIDGAHAGDSVNVLIDNHSVHLAQIHVDLLV
jgi:hypothetical protein